MTDGYQNPYSPQPHGQQPVTPGYGAPASLPDPYRAPRQPGPGRGGGNGPLIAGIVVASILLIVAVLVAALSLLSGRAQEASPAPATTSTSEPAGGTTAPTDKPTPSESAVYYINDRPRFGELVELATGRYEFYRSVLDDGESVFGYVPRTEEGLYYFKDFLTILADYKAATSFMLYSGSDADELDDQIDRYIGEITEVERAFLAGEDLGVTIRITREDGSVYESDGTAPAGVDITGAEELARTFVPSPDANNSYATAGSDLVSTFGLVLDWDFGNIFEVCSRSFDHTYTVAAYCSADPTRVFVNQDHPSFDAIQSDPSFVDFMKHEISHHLINEICGVTRPTIAGELTEGVTSSFAVVYLGADRDTLQSSAADFPEYGMTDETDQIAAAIHDEARCS